MFLLITITHNEVVHKYGQKAQSLNLVFESQASLYPVQTRLVLIYRISFYPITTEVSINTSHGFHMLKDFQLALSIDTFIYDT